MQRLAATLVLLAGCAFGSPPGFSEGDRWTAPLVAPLEGGRLLVPVSINDTGPYLFVVDPDSERSAVDESLRDALQLYTVYGPDAISEADRTVHLFIAEVLKLDVGTLSVRNLEVRVVDDGTFFARGRRVRGILGNDVIADSLIFTVDRDAGLMHLATQGNQDPPADAAPVRFRPFYDRRLASATVNQSLPVTVHLDLGARATMLWPHLLTDTGLPEVAVATTLRDEYGTAREVRGGAMIGVLDVGGVRASGVVALPFGDRRVDTTDFDGAVGQNFFSRFHVTANWHQKTVWLAPRDADLVATADARIGRFGDALEGCARPACVEVRAAAVGGVPGGPPGQAPPTATLRIDRAEPGLGQSYDVLLEALGEGGRPLGLPRLLASLPAGVPQVVAGDLDPAYAAAASFAVLDVNPVAPRPCRDGRCVWPMTALF